MTDWSLVSEYFALILLAVIALFFYDTKPLRGYRRRRLLYWGSLALSALSIVLNITVVNIIENIHEYSVSLAMGLNTLYFFVSWLMISVMVYYLFVRILEFVYDTRYRKSAFIILAVILGVFTALLIYNIPSRVIFYFDDAGNYCRGPLNAIGYVLPAGEVLMLLACYFVHRKSVGSSTEKILFVGAPIALLLILYQTLYPEQLLNGAICSLVNLIIFISYRGGRADQDPLTGLDNPHCFMTELMHRTAGRQDYQVILIALRDLTRISRAYGQKGGEAVLFQLGEALQELAGSGRAFRYSNDQFALLYYDADKQNCDKRLSWALDKMSGRWKLGVYDMTLDYAAIDLRYSGQPWTIEDISGYLNDAIHIVTADNLDFLPFDENLVNRRQRRDYVLRSMHSALEQDRFSVWYQPVYYHSSGKFESAEALLRMTDENGDTISPNEFIPIAEETGIIDDLTALVLERTCRLLKDGGIKELKAVSVNLPIRQVVNSRLRERLREIVNKYSVRPEQLRLEITERDVVENGYAATQVMRDLSESGYRFMLDDFGIGYSNLSRVLSMPLESIKLDRSLVILLEENPRHLNVIKNYVVPLFRQLGQSVVAEGVETEHLANLIYDCDVDRIQGFYYAAPMSEDALRKWYAEREAEGCG